MGWPAPSLTLGEYEYAPSISTMYNIPLLITLWFQETGDAYSRLLKAFIMREVLSFRQQTFASSTKKGYRTHRNAYLPFCNSIWDIPQFLLLHRLSAYVYASFLARSLKYNSVKQFLNILRIFHLEWGFPNPLLDNFYLRFVLQGCPGLPLMPRATCGDEI